MSEVEIHVNSNSGNIVGKMSVGNLTLNELSEVISKANLPPDQKSNYKSIVEKLISSPALAAVIAAIAAAN